MKILANIVAVVVLLIAGTASGADGVGEASAVVDSATTTGKAGEQPLAVGAEVYLGDQVSTDASGQAQLLFSDGTRLVVGSNASLVIDAFLFRSGAADNKFSVRALGGAFRFISGQSGERAYSIRTPTGTIGVRGTAFDFWVNADGTGLLLLEGAATLCAGEGNCETVTAACQVMRVDRDNRVETIYSPKMRLRLTRQRFPFQVSQSGLLGAFRINGKGCAAADAGNEAGNSGGGGDGDGGGNGGGQF